MAFCYFKYGSSFRTEVVSSVIIFKFFFFLKCYIWIYYTICKNLKPIATQQLLTHCFSEIILQVLRNPLITPQRGFLWKSEISCCWGFWSSFVLVCFPKKCITYEMHPGKSFMGGEGCAVLETTVLMGCWNWNLWSFSRWGTILINLSREPDRRLWDKQLLLCRKLDLSS